MHEPHLDAAAAIRSAFDFARRGQLERAEEICGEVLRHHADHSEALFLRGVIEVQTGRTADAAKTRLWNYRCSRMLWSGCEGA
jgi:Flp pilus assembly protein TadD